MAEADTIDRAKSRKVQVASLPPGRQRPRLRPLARQADGRARPGRRRRDRDRRQALDRGARDPPLWRGRGHRHHPPRRAAARQRRRRIGRLCRGQEGGIQARDARRVRPGAAQRPAAGLGRRAQAHLRRAAAGRRRYGLDDRPPARQRRHARPYPAAAQRAGLRASGAPAGRRFGGAQGHRPHRRQDRGRASARIYARRMASAGPTSPTTILAECATRSTRCARWSSCRCAIPSCSSGSASIRPRACCSTARRAPARPCWRAPSPTRARRNSS